MNPPFPIPPLHQQKLIDAGLSLAFLEKDEWTIWENVPIDPGWTHRFFQSGTAATGWFNQQLRPKPNFIAGEYAYGLSRDMQERLIGHGFRILTHHQTLGWREAFTQPYRWEPLAEHAADLLSHPTVILI